MNYSCWIYLTILICHCLIDPIYFTSASLLAGDDRLEPFGLLQSDRAAKLGLHFKTKQSDGMLVHLAAVDSYATITLRSSRLHVRFKAQDSGEVSFWTPAGANLTLGDDRWHQTKFHRDGDTFWLVVDGQTFAFGDSIHISPHQQIGSVQGIFVGGCGNVDESSIGCFHGCISNVTVNGVLLDDDSIVPHALDCQLTAATTTPPSHVRLLALRAQSHVFNDYAAADDILQPVYVNDQIVVKEGQSVKFEDRDLYVYQQHKPYYRDEKEIIFHALGKPQNGVITVEDKPLDSTFTYADVQNGFVNYTHDGSETRQDFLELEVEFRNLSHDAPKAFKRRYTYSLSFKIEAVNDLPILQLPLGSELRLPEHSRLPLTQDHLLIADSDDPPTNVRIRAIYNTPGGATFEHLDRPGLPLNEFSQDDLIAGRIRLMHMGPVKSRIEVVATDGKGESQPVTLEITAYPVQLQLRKNTGVHVLLHSHEIISSMNLSFTTNLETGGRQPDVRYKVTQIPMYGFVELQDMAGKWWIAPNKFNQSHIDQGLVRYRHAKQERATSDMFKFQVSALNTTSQIVYDFKVTFVPVNIKVFNPSPFLLNASQQAFLSRDHLFAWTFPRSSPAKLLIYHVTGAPKYGFLYRVVDRDSGRHRRLGLYSNFSQADIDKGNIFYRLHFVHYSILNDQFRFKIVAPSVSSEQLQFDITFIPGEEGIHLVNRTIIVGEGRLQKILNTSLYLETPDDKDFLFTIAIAPSNGEFHRLIPGGPGTSQLHQGHNFTTQDLLSGGLFYKHDDSESSEDKAYLVARPLHRITEDARIPFWLNIRVILENDHEPERLTMETFHVVTRGERILTNRDLEYVDMDSDFNSKNLRYVFPHEYTNAGFYMMRMPDVPVYNFSQDDINQRRVLLRHLGKKTLFSLLFRVTDGHKSVESHFVVNASTPFLREKINTGIVLQRGGMAVIGPKNLTVDTNLNHGTSSIIYEVTDELVRGNILVLQAGSDQGKPGKSFNQNDIDNNRVLYGDASNVEKRDVYINMRVEALASRMEIWIRFKVSIRSGQKPLLKTEFADEVVVNEGGVAQIDSTTLKATHQSYMPGSISYTVVEQPRYGTLILDSIARPIPTQLIGHSNFYVHHFSQFDVDRGNLQYMHGRSKTKRDHFKFNVTAGNERSSGPYKLKIRVVKNQINLQVANLTVPAGGKAQISRLTVRATSPYHDNPKFTFHLHDFPRNGFVQNSNGTVLKSFTSDQLSQRVISYAHNGDSSWSDQFSIKALFETDGNAESEPQTIFVKIVHRNNKAPEIVRNSALQMWSNRVAPLSARLLLAEDPDTPPEQIRFLVTSPNNGYLAFMVTPTQQIYNFSQADVNMKRVAFVRFPNGTSGGFSFILSDGQHQVGPIWYSVEAAEVNVALEANSRLVLAPGTEAVIGMDLLRANIAGTQTWQVLFTVTRQPRHGQLLLRGEYAPEFTQLDINQRLVTYKHDTERPEAWTMKDAFHFTVSLNGSGSFLPELEQDGRFRIVVSYAALAPQALTNYMGLSTLLVPEGGSLAINDSHINSTSLASWCKETLVMRIVKLPRRGVLQFGGKSLTEYKVVRLTQTDINDHMLVYHQRSTDKPQAGPDDDSIGFELFPSSEGFGKRRQLRLKFQLFVQIIAINSKQFTVSRFPEILRLVRGTTLPITSTVFLVENPGTAPSEITYSLFQGPIAGYFTLNDARTSRFSQADINKSKVKFVQSGGKSDGSFSVRVSAPHVHPLTRFIRIEVNRLTLTLVNQTTIRYRQGTSYVILTKTHLGAQSNGPRDQIVYNVTRAPQNGTFLWVAGEQKATAFTQADIDGQRVLYAQLNLEAWRDAFTFRVSNSQNEIERKDLDILVDPAAKHPRPLRVNPGESVQLSTEFLDASEIEDKEPQFLIIVPPLSGQLTKRPDREKRSINDTEHITFFTFDDLKDGIIYYESNELLIADNQDEDSFTYELRATGMQPARAIFRIQILPSQTSATLPDTNTRRPPPAITPSHWLPSITQGYMIVVYILGAVVLLALLFIVIRKVRISRRRERQYLREKQQSLLQAVPSASLPSPQPDLLGTTVYASVGARGPSKTGSNGRMTRSLTRDNSDKPAKGTKMTPPPPIYSSLRPGSGSDASTNRLITFDPGRTEVISSVPMCKVTPLTPRAGFLPTPAAVSSSGNSSADDYRYAYQYSSSASDTELKCDRLSLDRATGFRNRKTKNAQPTSANTTRSAATKLKDNQYWV